MATVSELPAPVARPSPGPCARCHKPIVLRPGSYGTGYGDHHGRPICYDCCGAVDAASMMESGRIMLYLTTDPKRSAVGLVSSWRQWEVTNWPGTLRFRVRAASLGRHNLARTRIDVWFTGPDGRIWHGVSIGDHTQVCHCRRTARRRLP
jgi:hypothetical protein